MTLDEIENEIFVIEWQLSFARDRDIIQQRKERLKELQKMKNEIRSTTKS